MVVLIGKFYNLIYTFDEIFRYSRKILWLKVASSNNDPRIISSYFVDAVRSQGQYD